MHHAEVRHNQRAQAPLHEVVRLSGINVSIGGDDYPLVIKVASLPNARLQVYFLDNEDFFKRKTVICMMKHDKWYDDNGLRTVLVLQGGIGNSERNSDGLLISFTVAAG